MVKDGSPTSSQVKPDLIQIQSEMSSVCRLAGHILTL